MFSEDLFNSKGFFLKCMGLSLCDRNKGGELGSAPRAVTLAKLGAERHSQDCWD